MRRPGGARTLGDAITGHLHSRNVDPAIVTWDAWRREDGRWSLTGRYSIQGHEGMAELTFDQPGNFVVLDNDDAHWLVGDVADPVAEPEPRARRTPPERGARGAAHARRRRARHHRRGRPSTPPAPSTSPTRRAVREGLQTDQPLEAFLDDQPGLDESELIEEAADAAALDEDPDRRPATTTRPRAGP